MAGEKSISVETKEARASRKKQSDRERLQLMTKTSFDKVWSVDDETHPENVCGYLLGVFLELDGNNHDFRFEVYQNGDLADTF